MWENLNFSLMGMIFVYEFSYTCMNIYYDMYIYMYVHIYIYEIGMRGVRNWLDSDLDCQNIFMYTYIHKHL
jgi:hypothetical protein